MKDHSDLEALARAASTSPYSLSTPKLRRLEAERQERLASFHAAANPERVMGLIAELYFTSTSRQEWKEACRVRDVINEEHRERIAELEGMRYALEWDRLLKRIAELEEQLREARSQISDLQCAVQEAARELEG